MASRNRLGDESSPYLRQHRDNPVDWYPWGSAAFAEARTRDVPVLVSVGYSSCHWCHVMAHESFEDPETAALMNELCVNVKVDREERPDVDALYMEAVQAQTGRGGWPMTVFCDPEGRPLFGGTYFRRDDFRKLLRAVDDAWRNRRDELMQQSTALLTAMRASAEQRPVPELPGLDVVNEVLPKLAKAFDSEHGGFGRAPKFPSTHHLELVLRAYMATRSEAAETMVRTTLDAMASGGINDHLGGGFARYSTDREWLVPHFEKMLPDQALIARIYLHGYAVFGETSWSQVATETISYVLRELRHPDGGFFSAQDADSADPDGVMREGWYATWTPDEVAEVVGSAAAPAVCEWWGITAEGHLEGRSVPNRVHDRGRLGRPAAIEMARARLFAARSGRPRPGLDDQVITEWNALFLSTLAEASAISGRPDWRAAAIANGEFLLRELRDDDGRWARTWHADGSPRARHRALAADHAALVDAFIRLGELTGEARWTRAAVETAETMLDEFWDVEHGGLFVTPEGLGEEELIVRRKDLHDGATPSANSTAAIALYRLAALTGEQRYAHQADRIIQLLAAVASNATAAVSNALIAIEMRRRGLSEVVIAGERPDLVRLSQLVWRPDAVLAWGERFDSPLWHDRIDGLGYVCRDHVCQLPQDTVEGFFHQLTGQPLPDRVREEIERITSDRDE